MQYITSPKLAAPPRPASSVSPGGDPVPVRRLPGITAAGGRRKGLARGPARLREIRQSLRLVPLLLLLLPGAPTQIASMANLTSE